MTFKKKSCSVDGCLGKYHAKGFCQKHYVEFCPTKNKAVVQAEYRRRLKEEDRVPKKRCSFPGCDARHHAKGYCHLHYDRFVKKNNPERAKIRRARKKGVEVEKFSNQEIFDNCKWICGICGKSVDKNLKFPHPESQSLDHIVPISKGGGHVKSNVQLAHLGCNMKKGANSTPTLSAYRQ